MATQARTDRSERDAGGSRLAVVGPEDGLLLEPLLVGGADRLDVGAALARRLARVEQDDELGVFLDDRPVFLLPLAVAGEHGQAGWEAGGDLLIEEGVPLGFADRGAVGLGGAEVEL